MSPPQWPDIDALTPAECALFMRGYRLGLLAGAEDAAPADERCDWEHGIACCPGCGAVIQVVARNGKPPRVTDGDGREHYCQRQIAAVLQRHGVDGMAPILKHYGERAPIGAPGVGVPTPAPQPPAPWERWQ